jgi:hypothetical protein
VRRSAGANHHQPEIESNDLYVGVQDTGPGGIRRRSAGNSQEAPSSSALILPAVLS